MILLVTSTSAIFRLYTKPVHGGILALLHQPLEKKVHETNYPDPLL